MISGSALVVYITTYVVGVKLSCDFAVDKPPAFAALRVPLLLTQKGEGPPLALF